jgi:amino acid transporter
MSVSVCIYLYLYICTYTGSTEHRLGQWLSTSISGNDITSSILYTTGICISDAGIVAPITMIAVACTLYLFRSVYGEAVTALPLNGGAYNVLLNTTSKSTAALAACLTILSYIATGVVSAASAIEYAKHLYHDLPTEWCVLILLIVFALLCLIGKYMWKSKSKQFSLLASDLQFNIQTKV